MLVVENVFRGAKGCGALFLLGVCFVKSVVWVRGGG
jgi:hypothetical protein